MTLHKARSPRPGWRLLALLALILSVATLVHPAQAQPRQFELTPTVGYRFFGDLEVDDTEFLGASTDVEDGAAYGLSFDIPLTSILKLELLANHQTTDLTVDNGLFSHASHVADLDIDYYHVGLLVQFGSGQVRPFFVGSLGLARLDADFGAGVRESEDRPSASLGGGVKVFFSEHVGLRFEGRAYAVALDDDNNDNHRDRDRDRDRDRWDNEDSLVQSEASIGLIFAW